MTLRNAGIFVGLWIAQAFGWVPPVLVCPRPHLPADAAVDLAVQIVKDVEARFGSSPGPVKAREALRSLMNVLPEASTKDLNLLIELALQ